MGMLLSMDCWTVSSVPGPPSSTSRHTGTLTESETV